MNIDHSKLRRQRIRWTLLIAAWYGKESPQGENAYFDTARAVDHDCTQAEVRDALAFLDLAGLIDLQKDHDGNLWAQITQKGCEVYEYNAACPPGLGRPEKYS
jgi:hypothetical protein